MVIIDKLFIEIFNLYKNDIYRLAYSYTKNVIDADDISQNVFIKLYKHKDIIYKDKITIKKWLIKVTINECKSLFNSTWWKKIRMFVDREDENIRCNVNYDNEVLLAIMNLDKKYRIVIYLYYYEGYKIKEISDLLNISMDNVRTRLLRARNQLKDILKEDFE